MSSHDIDDLEAVEAPEDTAGVLQEEGDESSYLYSDADSTLIPDPLPIREPTPAQQFTSTAQDVSASDEKRLEDEHSVDDVIRADQTKEQIDGQDYAREV